MKIEPTSLGENFNQKILLSREGKRSGIIDEDLLRKAQGLVPYQRSYSKFIHGSERIMELIHYFHTLVVWGL